MSNFFSPNYNRTMFSGLMSELERYLCLMILPLVLHLER